MYLNSVTIIGLFAFVGLPRISCYKYASAYHESEEHPQQQQQQPTSYQNNDYYQYKQQSEHEQDYSNKDYSQSSYYPSSYAHQQSHPPSYQEGNEVISAAKYDYKDFEHLHDLPPPKHLSAPPDPPTDYSWLIKLGFVVIGKFLLKVLILKKIVKFFSVIVVLFVLPAFFATFAKHFAFKGFARNMNYNELNNQGIENLTKFVLTSIDGFKNAPNCEKSKEEWSCRLNRMFNVVDSKYPVKGLLTNLRKGFGFNSSKTNTTTLLKPTKVEYS